MNGLHRPYARVRGSEPSVTTIIGTRAIAALPWAAAKETARFAIEDPSWRSMEPAQAQRLLAGRHRDVWDAAAATGTVVHRVLEHLIAEEDYDVGEIVATMAERERQARLWRGAEQAVVSRVGQYVAGLEAWWMDFAPSDARSEECVRMPGVYVGQRDLRATIRGLPTLVDLKTSSKAGSVWHDAWALQLAAYRYAPEVVTYAEVDGKVAEVTTTPNEPVEQCHVVSLCGDGAYHVYRVAAEPVAFEAFLHLAAVHRWAKALGECAEVPPDVHVPTTEPGETDAHLV